MDDSNDPARLERNWMDSSLEEVLGDIGPATTRRALGGTGSAQVPEPVAAAPRDPSHAGAWIALLGAAVLILAFALGRSDRGIADGTRSSTEPPTTDTSRLRVLYLGDSPGWGFRYLKSSLGRADTIALDACLLSVDTQSAASAGLFPWSQLTGDFAGYRVILLGDLSPSAVMAMGEDPAHLVERLRSFVDAGGGLGVFCEGDNMPAAWRGTAMISLLPTESLGRLTDCEVFARVQTEQISHPIFRAIGSAAASALFDGTVETKVTLSTLQSLGAPRPNAQVLVADRDDTSLPLLVVMAHGRGRVAMLAIEDVWRLRVEQPDLADSFRASLVRWLGGQLELR